MELSSRYMPDRCLPDKVRVCVRVEVGVRVCGLGGGRGAEQQVHAGQVPPGQGACEKGCVG